MTFPQVTSTRIDTGSGEVREIPRTVLILGQSAADAAPLEPVAADAKTDLDKLLGAGQSAFKQNVRTFFLNAGQNTVAWLMLSNSKSEKWITEAVTRAQQVVSAEGVVVIGSTPAVRAQISECAELRESLISAFARRYWFLLACRGVQKTETWADYIRVLTALQRDIRASAVQLVPLLFGNDAGALAGRLCNRAVTLADSPARVASGAVTGLGEKPADSSGELLSLATLRALNNARFSVPAWYDDYEGIYWADGVTLDAAGGDYQVIEYVRVADEVARRVRLLAIAKIADRSLNSTPASMASHKQLFMRPMRQMSRSLQINGIFFPGECMPPQEGDVQIAWPDKNRVRIALVVRPYNSPKSIEISILLDTSTEEKK